MFGECLLQLAVASEVPRGGWRDGALLLNLDAQVRQGEVASFAQQLIITITAAALILKLRWLTN